MLNYIEDKNLHDISNINLEDIYWLLGDKNFYLNLRRILKEKKFFDLPIWSYSLLHKDIEGIFEFFSSKEIKDRLCNEYSLQHLITANFTQDNYLLKEYHPLLQLQAHNFSENKKISNL
jgi:hypothetical protein